MQVFGWVVPAVVGGLVTLGVTLLTPDDKGSKDDAAPQASTTVSATPTPSLSKSGTTPSSTNASTPSSNPSSSVAAFEPFPGEPMSLSFIEPPCRIRTEIDFDKVPFTHRVETELDDEPAQPGVDMVWKDCTSTVLETSTEARAGVIPQGTTVTKAACMDAANGGGLETLEMQAFASAQDHARRGATICILTDQGRLLAAYVTEREDHPTKLALKVRTMAG
ncbi:hypothetical protein ACWKT5_25115 [Streptomyces avermitilis]